MISFIFNHVGLALSVTIEYLRWAVVVALIVVDCHCESGTGATVGCDVFLM